MGLNIGYIPFFDYVNSVVPIGGDVAVLGSQEMHDPKHILEKFADDNKYIKFSKDHSVRNLFFERYKVASYTDYDLNDSADQKIDFGQPLPESMHGTCDVFLNAGTAEHIFKISQVFKGAHDMTRVNGLMVHIVPFSWYDHGFYNINPKLFYSMETSNNYKRISEAFFYPKKADKRKFGIFKNKNLLSGLKFFKIQDNYTKDAEIIRKNLSHDFFSVNILYFYASQKVYDDPFKVPYDIQL